MIAIQVKEEIGMLTEKKRKRRFLDRLRNMDLGVAVCCSLCVVFSIVLLVLLILNYEKFSA
jgi:hypothetical protein